MGEDLWDVLKSAFGFTVIRYYLDDDGERRERSKHYATTLTAAFMEHGFSKDEARVMAGKYQ